MPDAPPQWSPDEVGTPLTAGTGGVDNGLGEDGLEADRLRFESFSSTPAEITDLPGSPTLDELLQDPAWQALETARRQALEVYARHRLPVSPALYRRSGDRHVWRPADETLTAEERWDLIVRGSESGWRLVGLERVGRIGRTRIVEVQMAATILSLTEALTRRLEESDAGARADMARAFELGRLTAAADAQAERVKRRKRRRARLRARARRLEAERSE